MTTQLKDYLLACLAVLVAAVPPGSSSEHSALVALYEATAGGSWAHNDGWLEGSYCDWLGVNCTGTGSGVATLALDENGLRGTVPGALADLTQLTDLKLMFNSLSGTVPAELALLTRLAELALSVNDFSGTIPAKLASLTQLSKLRLYQNSLSGTIPAELASLTQLSVLGLGLGSLSGTVPAKLASLTQITKLWLNKNKLSGTVPAELADLTHLTLLFLKDNRLSGTVPVELARLSAMQDMDLGINRLSGTLPTGLASFKHLAGLGLQANMFSGHLPLELPRSLTLIILHANRLSGTLPSFASHSSLRALTLFGNDLGGRLRLPKNHAPYLQILAVHRNRLSCPVEYNASSYNMSVQLSVQNNYETGALIAPGNRLSAAAKPPWALMSEVGFQWAPEAFWQQWQTEICVAIAGVLGGVAVIFVVLKANWGSFFRFRPHGLFERYSYQCVRGLLALGLAGLALMPVYASGAGEFECGQQWLGATLAYLSGSPTSEQAAAVIICVMLGLQAFVAVAMRFWSPLDLELQDTCSHNSLSWQRWLAVLLIWPLGTMVLSLPAFFAVLADSVPGDQNTLMLSQTTLDGFRYASAPLLTLIESVVVPASARALVGKGAPRKVVGLIALAQFMILLVVPFVTALAFGSDCYGLWIKFWEPCSTDDSFNLRYYEPATYDPETMITILPFTIQVTTHAEVCDSQPPAYGRCPRYVIESLAELLVSKLAFSAFVSPVLSIVLCLPWALRARAWVMRCVLRRSEYTYYLYLDIELAQAISHLAGSIILGVAVPELTLLACIALAGRLAAVHLVTSRLGVQFKEEHGHPPSWWYLLAALVPGSGLVLWFFVSNADRVHGEMIVYIGAPLTIALGGLASWGICNSILAPEKLPEDATGGDFVRSTPESVRFSAAGGPSKRGRGIDAVDFNFQHKDGIDTVEMKPGNAMRGFDEAHPPVDLSHTENVGTVVTLNEAFDQQEDIYQETAAVLMELSSKRVSTSL